MRSGAQAQPLCSATISELAFSEAMKMQRFVVGVLVGGALLASAAALVGVAATGEHCTLKQQRSSGLNTICTYSCASGERAIAVNAPRCSVSLDTDDTGPYRSPGGALADAMEEYQRDRAAAQLQQLLDALMQRESGGVRAKSAWVLWRRQNTSPLGLPLSAQANAAPVTATMFPIGAFETRDDCNGQAAKVGLDHDNLDASVPSKPRYRSIFTCFRSTFDPVESAQPGASSSTTSPTVGCSRPENIAAEAWNRMTADQQHAVCRAK
jgi:hypothetical protein